MTWGALEKGSLALTSGNHTFSLSMCLVYSSRREGGTRS